MNDYDYYIENKDNIPIIKNKDLIVTEAVDDYVQLFEVYDRHMDNFLKVAWVFAIMISLLAFSILIQNGADQYLIMIIFAIILLAILSICYTLTFVFSVRRLKALKCKGVLVKAKGDKAYVFNREQNVVTIVNYYAVSKYDTLDRVKIGSDLVIYKINNIKCLCFRG